MADDWDGAPCHDCRTPTCPRYKACEYYMVHDHIWTAAGMLITNFASEIYLCIGCLEQRLGRQLDARDFTTAPVTDLTRRRRRTHRLRNRLTTLGQQLILFDMERRVT